VPGGEAVGDVVVGVVAVVVVLGRRKGVVPVRGASVEAEAGTSAVALAGAGDDAVGVVPGVGPLEQGAGRK